MKDIEENLRLTPQFEKRGGLLPCVAQDAETGQILMIGSVNQEALDKTIEINKATFWSTSRDELWTKGLTSGDILELVEILIDCDQDALIYKVKPLGSGACHTYRLEPHDHEHRTSCFYRSYTASDSEEDKAERLLKNIDP